MKTQKTYIQNIIDYLEKWLCDKQQNRKFKKVGPRCFFIQTDVDTIFIKATDHHLYIITDGEWVIDQEQVIPLGRYKDCSNEESNLNCLLQEILSKF